MGAGSNGIIFDDLGFEVTISCILTSRMSQKRCVLAKLLKNTNRKPYTIYRMVPVSHDINQKAWRHSDQSLNCQL